MADVKTSQPENPVYNGKEHCPEITATFNGKELVPADEEHKGDYTIEYYGNVDVGAKTKATLTGQGNFTGTKNVYFSIMPLQLTDEMLQPIEDVTYKGGEWTPEIMIKAGEDIIPKTDYKVTYSENIHAGKATVLVEAASANCEGKVNGSFVIKKYSVTLTAKDASKTVGEADPETFDVTVGQAAEGDTVTFDPAVREAGEDVGTYKISIAKESVKISNETIGDVTADYEITVVDGTFTIKEKTPEPPVDPSGDDPADPSGDNPGNTSGGNDSQGPSPANYDPTVAESPLFNKTADEVTSLITGKSGDEGPKGTTYGLLQLRATKATRKQIKVTWKAVKGARKFMVFASPCGNKYKYKLQLTTTKKTLAFKKISGKLKKGTYYKFMVMDVDKNNKVIGLSKTIHVATAGKKVGNIKSIKLIKPKKKKLGLKKGKSFKVKAKAIPASKKMKVRKHRAITFETTNRKIATVTSKGLVRGVKKGSCYLYIYAQNGVQSRIKVVVK